MSISKKNPKVILFDGVCNLCNTTVQFIIKKDKDDLYRFTALQSETGRKLLTERNIDTEIIDSIIIWRKGSWHCNKAMV